LDLNRVVGGMTEMLGRLLGEDIALQLNFSGEPAVVEADPTMLEQILLNLSVNSRDAMPKGGRLAIRISMRDVDTAHIRKSVEASPGKFVCLSHTDTGGGIPPENIQRIFEPFFTTKELGKGTGLGLATVYGIVKQNNGFIAVASEPGNGATFTLYLPRHEAAASAAGPARAGLAAPAAAATILLVEDEAALLKIAQAMLTGLGYTVLAANRPSEALALSAGYNGPIQLLVSDVVMPEMNGSQLAAALVAQRPGLKRLFVSGYTADVIAPHGVLDPGTHFLQKPFNSADLAAKVREALGA